MREYHGGKYITAGLSLAFLGAATAACVATSDTDRDVTVSSTAQGLGAAFEVAGDTTCPGGYSLATPGEAQANQGAICGLLGTWDIARLSGGGSMDGPGYGCGVRTLDTRGLGNAVCKHATSFTRGTGDGVCPSGYTVANAMVARANASAICGALGTWDIARLAGGGSMDGPGYGCGIRDVDGRALGNTVCAQLTFARAIGDQPCPPGSALIAPQEARARQSALCGLLGTWDIARLDGGGSMDGPGYGCGIRDADSRGMGNALCGAL